MVPLWHSPHSWYIYIIYLLLLFSLYMLWEYMFCKHKNLYWQRPKWQWRGMIRSTMKHVLLSSCLDDDELGLCFLSKVNTLHQPINPSNGVPFKQHLHFVFHFMGEVNRVNMPPTEHHLVIEHPSCAYLRLVNGCSPLCKCLNETLWLNVRTSKNVFNFFM